jgi:spoIIIJ-associated protein
MTTLFEFEGKNVDKAVDIACEELNIPRDEINYEVLSYGSSGIFGIAGAKKARIRVNLAETSEERDAHPVDADQEDVLTGDTSSVVTPSSGDDDSDGQQLYSFPEDPLDLGRAALHRIIDAITSDTTISADKDAERIRFNVVGGNAAILIGKKGQTLEAIQSLIEKIVNKHNNHSEKIRIQVDVEGYLETRKANLEKLATRLADKSKRIGKPISLGQMSAHDRRIIHLALKEHPDVRTKSRGEGYMRKLVIFPNKNSASRRNYHLSKNG